MIRGMSTSLSDPTILHCMSMCWGKPLGQSVFTVWVLCVEVEKVSEVLKAVILLTLKGTKPKFLCQ